MSATPYFPFYPGDYLADTMGLSCCEHGTYLLLLAVSWQRGPLPDDMDHLQRLAANPSIEALRYILQEYWTLTERGWINARMEREREKLEQLKARQSAAGKAAVEAREAKRIASNRHRIDNEPTSNADRIDNGALSNQNHIHNQKKEEEKNHPYPPKAERWKIPAWVNAKAWAEFEQHRRDIKKPMTDLARTKAANVLKGMTHSQQQACIDKSIQSRWPGLFSGRDDHKGRNQSGSWQDDLKGAL